MGFNVDFTQVEDKNFDPIPKGRYTVVVSSTEIKESKSTPGNYYINWEFEVMEGDFAGRKVWAMTTLKPGAEWKAKAFFKNLGFDISVSSFDIEEAITNAIGLECQIDVVLKKGTDQYPDDKNDVNKIVADELAAGGGGSTDKYL
jgi:hypothetical protein